jgi:UDP-glucose 4-epimerase
MQHEQLTLVGMPCVVLGGGGFIGTHLCQALTSHRALPRGFGRSLAHPEALASIPWHTGEFSDRSALARAVEGSEIVFHLLGGSTPESSNKDPLGDLLGSTAATLQLLEICRAAKVRKVVFVSSGGTVYGIPKHVPIPESAPTDPISAYGISKLSIEKYLHLYKHLYGLDFTVMRVANPFGPYQNPTRRQGLIAALMHRVLNHQPIEIWGDGNVVRDFVYVDDVIDALIGVIGYNGPHRIFNVGAGVGRSVIEVAEDIASVFGHDIQRVFKPGRPTDVPTNVLDISLIGAELGWHPKTPWINALKQTGDWLKSLPTLRD